MFKHEKWVKEKKHVSSMADFGMSGNGLFFWVTDFCLSWSAGDNSQSPRDKQPVHGCKPLLVCAICMFPDGRWSQNINGLEPSLYFVFPSNRIPISWAVSYQTCFVPSRSSITADVLKSTVHGQETILPPWGNVQKVKIVQWTSFITQ